MNAHAQTSPDPGRARSLRLAVLLATYMQSANLPLPNAVLRLIQGSLSMTDDQAGWIFTAYLAASAITMPIAQWLAARFGVKRVYQAALAFFVLGLLLATVATTPLEFIGARIIQGLASGVLAPLSMAIAMETLAPEKRMKFGATWTAIVLFGIVSGPCIGGWIAEHFDWRPIFYISLPLSAYIFLVVALLLAEKKAEKAPSFDFFGFGSFTLGLISLQMLLDRGERLDWFDSPEIWVEALACGLGLYLFMTHVLASKAHFLNKRLFSDRNFVLSTIIFFAVGFVLLSTMALTSPMLDEILGYPPDTTGALTMPRGIGLVGAFLLMGRLAERFDRRLFVAAGVALVVYANWLMLGFSPLMDWSPVAVAGAIQGIGIGMLMPALTKVAFGGRGARCAVSAGRLRCGSGSPAGAQRQGPSVSNFYAIGPRVGFDLDVFGGNKRLIEQRFHNADSTKTSWPVSACEERPPAGSPQQRHQQNLELVDNGDERGLVGDHVVKPSSAGKGIDAVPKCAAA